MERADALSMTCTGIAHVGILVSDLERSLAFYVGVLGLKRHDQRPDLGYRGAWLDLPSGQQIHLLELAKTAAGQDAPPGRDAHLAIHVRAIDNVRHALANAHTPFSPSRSGRRAIFCRDPDGNALEFIESQPAQN
ncbi:MAG: VOC family protein [Acidiferrobacteraceae bacterium]